MRLPTDLHKLIKEFIFGFEFKETELDILKKGWIDNNGYFTGVYREWNISNKYILPVLVFECCYNSEGQFDGIMTIWSYDNGVSTFVNSKMYINGYTKYW